jgi:hypothetical protein
MTGRTGEWPALRRYCSGCSRETEHVLWPAGGPSDLPLIQWEGAEPAGGTTMCRACGERRAAPFRPNPVAWSSWPREPPEPAAEQDAGSAQAEPEPARSFALRRVRLARHRVRPPLVSGGPRRE